MNSSISFYSRARRSDGESTRNDILNAAGQLFAEYGYAGTTNRAICDKAGTNTAAINYYFGGKDGLYEAVLVEAHSQIFSLKELTAIMDSELEAEEKLASLLKTVVRTARASSELWGIPVLMREMLNANTFPPVGLWEAILPKLHIVRHLVQEVSGLAADSPEGQNATVFLALSCLSLVIFPAKIKMGLMPSLRDEKGAFEEDMAAYVIGGLKAMRKHHSAIK